MLHFCRGNESSARFSVFKLGFCLAKTAEASYTLSFHFFLKAFLYLETLKEDFMSLLSLIFRFLIHNPLCHCGHVEPAVSQAGRMQLSSHGGERGACHAETLGANSLP